MICEFLGLFPNPLTPDNKYSLLNREYLLQHFQMQLSEKGNIFSQFFWPFRNLDSILNSFKKKMTLIAEVFLNLPSPKKVVRSMSKKSCFRGSFDNWHGKQTDKLLKSEREHLYHIYWSLWKQFSCKKSVLVICKILGLFVNPLTADDKYSLLTPGNLLQHF